MALIMDIEQSRVFLIGTNQGRSKIWDLTRTHKVQILNPVTRHEGPFKLTPNFRVLVKVSFNVVLSVELKNCFFFLQ